MTIPTIDIKILWAKAAGRCTMADCRRVLITNASENVSSRNVLVGENCHIVAESLDGPRGKSSLSPPDRSRNPNLILLCRNHHGIIDGDPDAWPIELLHQIKADHEIWVETQLTEKEGTEADRLYAEIVNQITEKLHLNTWDAISDHAIGGILFDDFVQGAEDVCAIVFKRVWPGDKPELESQIENLASHLNAYVKHFISLAHNEHNRWREDKTWKSTWRSDYDQYAERSSKWHQKSGDLLANLVIALNEYADAVRSHLNSAYFLLQGKFTIYDSLGVTNEMQGIYYLPKQYRAAES